MEHAQLIKTLDSRIAEASRGPLEESATLARRAISASAARAVLPYRRLSAAARMSISYAGMAFALRMSHEPGAAASRALWEIVETSLRISSGQEPTEIQTAPTDDRPPVGWQGAAGGPFGLASEGEMKLTILRKEFMPGGEWSFHCDGIPSAFGSSPQEAADRGEAFIATAYASRRRLPRVPGRTAA